MFELSSYGKSTIAPTPCGEGRKPLEQFIFINFYMLTCLIKRKSFHAFRTLCLYHGSMSGWVFIYEFHIFLLSLATVLRFSVGVHSDLKVYHCRENGENFHQFQKTIRRPNSSAYSLLLPQNPKLFFIKTIRECFEKFLSLNLDTHHNDTSGHFSSQKISPAFREFFCVKNR